MIPLTSADLEGMVAEAQRQLSEVDEIVAANPAEALAWRPSEAKWSVSGHIAHMCLTNEPYLAVMEERIRSARDAGSPLGTGPYRHPSVARWFARSMEPPPKRRWKTTKQLVPDPTLGSDDALRSFRALQSRLATAIGDARGLDLGKIRFGSPFAAVLRLSLGTAFEVLLAHNRRHVWLIRELLEARRAAGVDAAPPRG